jgi:hypothetical protein
MRPRIKELYACLESNLKLFELPIIVEDGCDVFPILFEKMNQYLDFIRNNNCINDYYRNAENIVNRLKLAIRAYLHGWSNEANKNIKLIFEDAGKLNGKLVISTIDECLFGDEGKQLYKARVGGFYPFREEEMFHIPFDKRGLIQNQRYSINGMPCLYLGTSSYVCWEELGRPDFNTFWVSRFEVTNKELKILNLSYTIQDIFNLKNNSDNNDELEKLIEEYFLYWIIQCACSISVKNKNRVFREEYIVPQLIMRNIRSLKIDGIMYFSVKGKYMEGYNSWIMKNFAFPADDYDVFEKIDQNKLVFNSKKYNEYKLSNKLRNAFSLTAPLNMGLIRVAESDNAMGRASKRTRYLNEANLKGIDSGSHNMNLYRTGSTITLSEKNYLRYKFTYFYELEVALGYMLPNHIA